MPNIPVAPTADLGLRPSEVGVESVAAAGRRLGGFYNQAAGALTETGARLGGAVREAGNAAVDYLDHQDIMAGAVHGAQLFDNLTKSKDDTIKAIDPNDPEYGHKVELAIEKWRQEQLEPSLDTFRGGFSTEKSQAWAEHFIDQTRQHMFVSSAADVSTAAGIGIQNSVRTFANTATNTALRDPTAVQAQLDLAEHTVSGLVGSSSLKGTLAAKAQTETLEKVREQIVKAGAIGAIQKSANPEQAAEDWIGKYPQYINGAEALQLAANARQQIRARNYDFETNRRRDKEVATDKSNEATAQYLIDVRSRDPKLSGDPTAQKILNDPTLLKQDKNNLLNLIDRQLKPETDARISHETFVNLLRELRQPNADPKEVEQKAWDARLTDPGKPGSMTETDFNQFRVELTGKRDNPNLDRARTEFFKSYAATIDPGLDTATGEGGSALGSQKRYQAEQDARRLEAALRAKGDDPQSLYDSHSPNFFGKRIYDYRASAQEQMEYAARLKEDRARTNTNLTGPDRTITGVSVTNAPPQPPPMETRKANAVYPTPRGPMRWTGTGWVAP